MISPEVLAAGAVLVCLNIYILLGGADFGGGFWELFPIGPRKKEQDELIKRAIGPVWEANHVWLIVIIVILFTAFPPVFSTLMTVLFAPIVLMLLGIALRGTAFAIGTSAIVDEATQRFCRPIFALSSLITPFFFGTIIGAVSSGQIRVIDGNIVAGFQGTWLKPFPIAVGVFTIFIFAYLAAVYLTLETNVILLKNDFRKRALFSLASLIITSPFVFILARNGAPRLFEGLTGSPWSVLILSGAILSGVINAWGLISHHLQIARLAAGALVSIILWGWGLSQFPALLEPDLTIYNSVGSPATVKAMLIALGTGLVFLGPALYYLMSIFKGKKIAS